MAGDRGEEVRKLYRGLRGWQKGSIISYESAFTLDTLPTASNLYTSATFLTQATAGFCPSSGSHPKTRELCIRPYKLYLYQRVTRPLLLILLLSIYELPLTWSPVPENSTERRNFTSSLCHKFT